VDPIRALDEQIKELERTIIKLKRARNSFLNISKLPPEVLGQVFSWNVIPWDDFGGLGKRSHNFLLVCHYWFEVSSHTPDLWSFWGTTPEDWIRWYPHSGTSPLDLVLDGLDYDNDGHLDTALRNELQDRAARDAIRQVHLRAEDTELLSSIVSLLTTKCEGTRTSSVESFALCNYDDTTVDVSDFFSHHRFPKLRHLLFANCTISSWDNLASRTGVLTTLDIGIGYINTSPTTSQLLSLFASNPLLQTIALDRWATPFDDSRSSFRVTLRHLKQLRLIGDLQDVFGLLHWLDHPKNMDLLILELDDCSVGGVSQLLGPYFRDYLRGRGKSQNGLEFGLYSTHNITLHVRDVPGTSCFVAITVGLREALHREARERVVLDLFARAPWEEVVHLKVDHNLITIGNIYPRFPNLRVLAFDGIILSVVFPEPDVNDGALLSLRHLCLTELVVDGDDWSPLTTFLACHASFGNRLDTLDMTCSPHVDSATMEVIRGMVGEVKIDCQGPPCIFGTCPDTW